jgi:hypothetical protein
MPIRATAYSWLLPSDRVGAHRAGFVATDESARHSVSMVGVLDFEAVELCESTAGPKKVEQSD